MDTNIIAALIGVGGAVFLALVGNVCASIYFAGRISQRVDGLEKRFDNVESAAEKNSLAVAKMQGRLEQIA